MLTEATIAVLGSNIAQSVLQSLSMAQSHVNHSRDAEQQIKGYQVGTHGDITMTLLQTDSDISFARSEAERDFYDQKNQQLQTLIISASVMVGAQISIFIQGILPDGTNPVLIASFGLVNGFSFCCLFLSIIYCLEISRLSSEFMIKRSNLDLENHNKTQEYVKKFIDDNKRTKKDSNWQDALTTKINQVADDILEANRRRHRDLMSYDWNGFWENVCNEDYNFANFMFYIGSVLVMVGCLLWALAQFQIKYGSNIGGYLAIAPLILAVLVGVRCIYKYRYTIPIRGNLLRYIENLKEKRSSDYPLGIADYFSYLCSSCCGCLDGNNNDINSRNSRNNSNGNTSSMRNQYNDPSSYSPLSADIVRPFLHLDGQSTADRLGHDRSPLDGSVDSFDTSGLEGEGGRTRRYSFGCDEV